MLMERGQLFHHNGHLSSSFFNWNTFTFPGASGPASQQEQGARPPTSFVCPAPTPLTFTIWLDWSFIPFVDLCPCPVPSSLPRWGAKLIASVSRSLPPSPFLLWCLSFPSTAPLRSNATAYAISHSMTAMISFVPALSLLTSSSVPLVVLATSEALFVLQQHSLPLVVLLRPCTVPLLHPCHSSLNTQTYGTWCPTTSEVNSSGSSYWALQIHASAQSFCLLNVILRLEEWSFSHSTERCKDHKNLHTHKHTLPPSHSVINQLPLLHPVRLNQTKAREGKAMQTGVPVVPLVNFSQESCLPQRNSI